MLIRLIKNEFIKLFKKPKTWIVIALFIALIGTINFLAYRNEKMVKYQSSYEYKKENILSNMDYSNNSLEELEEEYENTSDKNKKEKIKEKIEGENNYLKEIKNDLLELEKEKNNPEYWKEALKKENEVLKEELKDIEKGDIIYKEENKHAIEKKIENNNLNLKNPTYEQEYGFSVGENFNLIFSLLGVGILSIGISIFMYDIISGECTPPTFKFLLIQPISRSKVILSKYITVVISTLLLIIGIETIITLASVGFLEGFDSLNNVIYINEKFRWVKDGLEKIFTVVPGSGEYVTYGNFLVRAIAVQALYIITATTFVFMISSLFKNSVISMVVSIVTSLTVIFTSILNINMKEYLFLIYADSGSLITGELAENFNNPALNLSTGVTVMIVSTIIFYIIGHLNFIKKDILI